MRPTDLLDRAGSFARRTGAMVGLDVPVIPVEHQYIVTEPHPAIVERHRRGLPLRGQRTRTNARTRKGPRKGAAALKK